MIKFEVGDKVLTFKGKKGIIVTAVTSYPPHVYWVRSNKSLSWYFEHELIKQEKSLLSKVMFHVKRLAGKL